MLRIFHKAISEKIAYELKLSEKNAQIFVDGSLGPDTHGDFPHQTGKEKKIMYKIEIARTRFHENDDECYGQLGNALHYIQDKWCNNQALDEKSVTILDDKSFLQSISQLATSEKTKANYLLTANTLATIKTKGIESWFNHSWAYWHKDFASCIYVFADILEMQLPNLNPEVSMNYSREKLITYVKSEAFEKSIKDAFVFSVMNNFVRPKLSGYSAAMYALASIESPSSFRDCKIDFNIAYRLSLEISRYTLLPDDQFEFADSWTHRDQGNKKPGLTFVLPKYHVLITRPMLEVQDERSANFEKERMNFLAEWPCAEEKIPVSEYHSDAWKILLSELVELLRRIVKQANQF